MPWCRSWIPLGTMEQQDRGCTRCDLRSDLPRLRTLRAWYAIWLARLDEAIAAAEQQEREREQGEQARAPAAALAVELGIGVGSPPIEVNVGGYYAAGKRCRAISRAQDLTALADGIRSTVCPGGHRCTPGHACPRRRTRELAALCRTYVVGLAPTPIPTSASASRL